MDRDRLIRGLDHVFYTIDQLIAIALWNTIDEHPNWRQSDRAVLKNACLESSLINLRILDEFFTPTGRDKNRIKAKFYADYRSTFGQMLTKEESQKLNDHLAHLTFNRTRGTSPEWSHRMIYRCLPQVVHFLEHLLTRFLKPHEPAYSEASQRQIALSAIGQSWGLSKPS